MRRLLLLFTLAGCATTATGLGPATGPILDHVKVEGTKALDAGDILPHIATQSSSGIPFFRTTRHLDEAALTLDAKRIRSLYAAHGYFAAEVQAEVEPRSEGHVEVVFHVKEGQVTTVRSVLVSGLAGLPESTQAKILDDAPLRRDRPLVNSEYEATKQQILNRLLDAGYAAATVQGRVEVAPTVGAADVIFDAVPGSKYQFGQVQVAGAQLIPERLIREAAKGTVRPGLTYSPAALRAAQEEIYDLGPFAAVTATAAKPTENSNVLPVTLGVHEANFLRLRFGVGAGIDNQLQEARILADFSHLNVFGGMQRLDFQNQLAYVFIPSIVKPLTSGVAGQSTVQITQPNLFGPKVDLSGAVLYERQLLEAFSDSRIGARLALPWRLHRWLVITPSYNFSYYFDIRNESSLELQPGQRVPAFFGCTTPCIFSYLEQTLVVDRRDSAIDPRSGTYLGIGLQEGGGVLGGSFTWVRLLPEVRGYQPLSRNLLLAARLQVGWLNPLGDSNCTGPSPGKKANCSPVLARFFGGGAAGFRGYGADQLSPILVVPQPGKSNELVPVGGNSTSLASLELRWFFSTSWTTVFFTDVGNVATTTLGAFDPRQLELAVGTGLLYDTPVGPARLNVGFRPLNRFRVAFTEDGAPAPLNQSFIDRFTIFLSIGEAF